MSLVRALCVLLALGVVVVFLPTHLLIRMLIG